MLQNGRGLIKALENWAKKVTAGYKDVDVRDLSTSFRDGLAFCAIIHHYRPDLIDFDSLSKENIFENNSLAFGVAEKQLGVPALLDAEDMVTYAIPDRLSIITYLSQLRNCFENQNKVNKKHDLKRVQKSSPGPPSKISVVEPSINISRRHEVCQVCKHRVFILERLIVDGKLYHTTCFRCHKCNNLLNPGAYVESDTPGVYECSVCPDEAAESLDSFNETIEETGENAADDVETPVSKPFDEPLPEKEFISKEAVSFAKSNLSTESPVSPRSNIFLYPVKDSNIDSQSKPGIKDTVSSVKARINAFEKNQVNEKSNFPSSTLVTPEIKLRSSPSPVASRHSDIYSLSLPNKFSSQDSAASPKSPEKFDCESEKEKLLKTDLFAKETSPNEKPFVKEKIEKKPEVDGSEDNATSDNASPLKVPDYGLKSLHNEYKSPSKENSIFPVKSDSESPKSPNKVPDYGLKPSPNEYKNSSREDSILPVKSGSESPKSPNKVPDYGLKPSPNEYKSPSRENSIFQVKSGSESPKSPNKVPRDIFKSSLQPLKLSLSPSIRKETTDSSTTLSESEKNFDIPQIKSSYSTTLPHSSFGRSVSAKEPVDIKISSFESSLNNNSEIHLPRRSSFESGNEFANKESSDKSNIAVKSLKRSNSTREVGSLDETDMTKTGLKNYTSVYKSIYSASSLSDRKISRPNSNNLLTSPQSSEVSKVTSVKNEPTEKDACISDSVINQPNSISSHSVEPEVKELTQSIVSNKDLKDSPELNSTQDVKEIKEEEDYPDDLNPFGDEEDEKNAEEYPSDLNPFGDDEEVISSSKITVDDYDESKNPFASDDDDDQSETMQDTSFSTSRTSESVNKMSNLNDSVSSNVSSPSGSLRGTFKKRPAPKPPNVRDIFPKDPSDSAIDSSFNSLKTSPSIPKKIISTSSPKVRKNKPAPPPPPLSPSVQDPAARVKLTKESDNMKLKSSAAEETQPPKAYKKKKRPAPPVPVSIRRDMKKIPLKEIMREMKEIEEKQREYESQGREIELLIRNRDKDEEPSVEEEEHIMQLFELVNQKNALFRRQAELMYIKRSQRLEEQQYKIEKEIRLLMEKPESEKTDEDRQKEEELTAELIDIVDQRNSIIDSIEMDRRRELEEDHSVQEQFEMKNGDLTITAELKQKSGKIKKNKKDKKDKKKKEEEESGKGTLKKKKHLFSKKS